MKKRCLATLGAFLLSAIALFLLACLIGRAAPLDDGPMTVNVGFSSVIRDRYTPFITTGSDFAAALSGTEVITPLTAFLSSTSFSNTSTRFHSSSVSTQGDIFFYDTFDDGVIDEGLWWVSDHVSEFGGKAVLSTLGQNAEGQIVASRNDLVGMWFSAIGYQDIAFGEHVNIHLATKTPSNQLVTVGINRDIYSDDPPAENNKLFCQWFGPGVPEEYGWVVLGEAQWGTTYVFGLEYTSSGTVLVWVNGSVACTFPAAGADVAYSQGGAEFWFLADSVNGGAVTAEIDWAKARSKPFPVLLVHGYCDTATMWGPEGGSLNFAQALRDEGFLVETIDLIPKPTNGSIWNYGSQLFGKIAEMKEDYDVDQVDIVAHSLGGLAARAYAWQNSQRRDVRTLIMLGTPNNGSDLLLPRYWPFVMAYGLLFCEEPGEAAAQMTPGSRFLRDLNNAGLQPSIENYYAIAGNEPKYPLSLVLGGADDGVVQVASVHAIAGTTNYLYYVDHFEYDDDTTVFAAVLNILRGAISSAVPSVQTQLSDIHFQESALIEDSVGIGDDNHHPVPIDSTVSEVHFILASDGGELDFTLTTPVGTLITPTVAASNPLITYTNNITTLIGYEIVSPEQGNWTAHVATSGTASSDVSYAMLALLDSELSLSILLDENPYHVNEPVLFTAQLVNDSNPMTGAVLTAQIKSPGGSTQALSLYDDGSHGDVQTGDGIYSNLFTETILTGCYEVTVTASGTVGDEQFVRETATTLWVEYRVYLPLTVKNSF